MLRGQCENNDMLDIFDLKHKLHIDRMDLQTEQRFVLNHVTVLIVTVSPTYANAYSAIFSVIIITAALLFTSIDQSASL